MEVRTVSRAGRALRVGVRRATRAGEDQPPLIVFNGLGASLELLEPFIVALDDRTVIVIDAPGVGTRPPSMPYRLSSLARQANKILDELGIVGGPWT